MTMQIAFVLYDGFTALDIAGPHETLNGMPGHEPVFVAEQAGPVWNESRSLQMVAAKAFDEVPSPDIVVVPGGLGTRAFLTHEPILDYLRKAHETSTWTTSVCTGSLLLAAAGILDGKRATTHWLARETLAELGAKPVPDRLVEEGKVMTAAGVSSGIDMGLTLIQRMYGDEAAQAVQLGIEYDPELLFDSGSPEKAPEAIVELVRTVFTAQEEAFSASAA
jgi:transcriptional regulator GlxA family with amidase domain